MGACRLLATPIECNASGDAAGSSAPAPPPHIRHRIVKTRVRYPIGLPRDAARADDPSHEIGLANVPDDGFCVCLHGAAGVVHGRFQILAGLTVACVSDADRQRQRTLWRAPTRCSA
jgi:hypothetical protein